MSEPPETLYHYTTQKGLLGIVKSKAVWATDIFYLNDAMEYKYAVDLTSEIIKKRQGSYSYELPPFFSPSLEPREEAKSSSTLNDIVPSFPYRYDKKWIEYNMLDDFYRILQSFKRFHIFVFSLSKKGNLLSQWRGYCPHGNGYSIGFNHSALNHIIKERPFELVKCIYEKNDQEELINNLMDKFIKDIESKFEKLSNSGNSRDELIAEYILSFLPIASRLKSKSFDEEDEWRLISKPIKEGNTKIQFREGTSTIIPYTAVKLEEENHVPIERIIIAPTANKQLSKMAVDSLLACKDIKTCKIDISEIPYRAL